MADDTTDSSDDEEIVDVEFLVEHRLTTMLKQAIAHSDTDKVCELLQELQGLYTKEGNKIAAKICGKRIAQIKSKQNKSP